MMQMSAILPNFSGIIITRGCFHLRLLEQLGIGAYGAVYLAEDLSPHPHDAQFYAVKCLLRHPKGSELARQQQREIENHRLVSDVPNVVTLHAVIEEEFYTFLVLDLCEGSDLFGAIIDRGTFAHNDAAVKRTFLQIVNALHECHEKGVFHRDVKPENILCSKNDSLVYLADFGLSTRSKRSTNFGCGSSFYMSPECLGIYHKKKPYQTGPSDVWALGTILCNLVTGRNPWHIASPKADEGFRMYLSEGAAWLHHNLPMSSGAADILGRIFDINPATRITLPELREAIESLESFYPDAEPSTSVVLETADERERVSAASGQPQEADAAAAIDRQNAPGFREEDWEIHPAVLSTAVSHSDGGVSVATSATLAGTASTFVNDHDNDESAAASHPRPRDAEGEDDICSMSHPPPLSVSPESSSDSSSGEECDGPVTPETVAVDVRTASSSPVPELVLDDAPTSPARSQVVVGVHVEEVKEKKPRGSLTKLVRGMKKIRIRV